MDPFLRMDPFAKRLQAAKANGKNAGDDTSGDESGSDTEGSEYRVVDDNPALTAGQRQPEPIETPTPPTPPWRKAVPKTPPRRGSSPIPAQPEVVEDTSVALAKARPIRWRNQRFVASMPAAEQPAKAMPIATPEETAMLRNPIKDPPKPPVTLPKAITSAWTPEQDARFRAQGARSADDSRLPPPPAPPRPEDKRTSLHEGVNVAQVSAANAKPEMSKRAERRAKEGVDRPRSKRGEWLWQAKLWRDRGHTESEIVNWLGPCPEKSQGTGGNVSSAASSSLFRVTPY